MCVLLLTLILTIYHDLTHLLESTTKQYSYTSKSTFSKEYAFNTDSIYSSNSLFSWAYIMCVFTRGCVVLEVHHDAQHFWALNMHSINFSWPELNGKWYRNNKVKHTLHLCLDLKNLYMKHTFGHFELFLSRLKDITTSMLPMCQRGK